MPQIDLQDVVLDGDMAEAYTILRSSGQWAAGGWQEKPRQSIAGFGVVSEARAKDIAMLPEGDRAGEFRAFYSAQPLFTTRESAYEGNGTSDILVWQSIQYRILTVALYGNRGYWKAIAVRMNAA